MIKIEKAKEAHQAINGVATDLLIHIDELIDSPEDIIYWTQHLAKKCNISEIEALKLINENIS